MSRFSFQRFSKLLTTALILPIVTFCSTKAEAITINNATIVAVYWESSRHGPPGGVIGIISGTQTKYFYWGDVYGCSNYPLLSDTQIELLNQAQVNKQPVDILYQNGLTSGISCIYGFSLHPPGYNSSSNSKAPFLIQH